MIIVYIFMIFLVFVYLVETLVTIKQLLDNKFKANEKQISENKP